MRNSLKNQNTKGLAKKPDLFFRPLFDKLASNLDYNEQTTRTQRITSKRKRK